MNRITELIQCERKRERARPGESWKDDVEKKAGSTWTQRDDKFAKSERTCGSHSPVVALMIMHYVSKYKKNCFNFKIKSKCLIQKYLKNQCIQKTLIENTILTNYSTQIQYVFSVFYYLKYLFNTKNANRSFEPHTVNFQFLLFS